MCTRKNRISNQCCLMMENIVRQMTRKIQSAYHAQYFFSSAERTHECMDGKKKIVVEMKSRGRDYVGREFIFIVLLEFY